MNLRRFALALLVAGLATLVVDVVLNAVVFRQVYVDTAPILLPHDTLNARIFLGWGGLLVIVATFGGLFVRGGWVGIRGGLEFGGLLGAAGFAGVAGLASPFPWPPALLGAIGVQQLVNGLVLGLTFGLVYRPAADAGR